MNVVSQVDILTFLRQKYNYHNGCNSVISEFALPNLRPIYAKRRKTFDQTITSVGYVISSLHNHVCYNSVLVFLYMCVCVWFVLVLQFSIFHQQRTIFRAIVACGKSYFYSHQRNSHARKGFCPFWSLFTNLTYIELHVLSS